MLPAQKVTLGRPALGSREPEGPTPWWAALSSPLRLEGRVTPLCDREACRKGEPVRTRHARVHERAAATLAPFPTSCWAGDIGRGPMGKGA